MKVVDAINSVQKTRYKTAPVFTLNNYVEKKSFPYVKWHLSMSSSGDYPAKNFHLGKFHIHLFTKQKPLSCNPWTFQVIIEHSRVVNNSHSIYKLPSFSIVHQTYGLSVQGRKTILNPHFALTSSKKAVRHGDFAGMLPTSFGFHKLNTTWYFGA